MGKYSWLFVLVALTVVITIITGEVNALAAGITLDGGIDALPTEQDNMFSFAGAQSFFTTYLQILTFQIEGIPSLFAALLSMVFIPMQLVIGVIVGELVIKVVDLIPFT